MAWVKVPPDHHPLFKAALPLDSRIDLLPMFGGLAAKVNGHIFAGLFGRSAILALPEAEQAKVLAMPGASRFDPMGDGRVRSDKVMLPEATMTNARDLAGWIRRAFDATLALPPKAPKKKKKPAAAKPKQVKATPGKKAVSKPATRNSKRR